MRPPRRLCQAGPSERTIPRRTSGAPPSSAARDKTSAPSAGSAGPGRSNSIADSSCRATILVPGSRPAVRARIAVPSARTTSAQSALGNTCSEATTRSRCHNVPLYGGDWGVRITTTELCADAVAEASAAESCRRSVAAAPSVRWGGSVDWVAEPTKPPFSALTARSLLRAHQGLAPEEVEPDPHAGRDG